MTVTSSLQSFLATTNPSTCFQSLDLKLSDLIRGLWQQKLNKIQIFCRHFELLISSDRFLRVDTEKICCFLVPFHLMKCLECKFNVNQWSFWERKAQQFSFSSKFSQAVIKLSSGNIIWPTYLHCYSFFKTKVDKTCWYPTKSVCTNLTWRNW